MLIVVAVQGSWFLLRYQVYFLVFHLVQRRGSVVLQDTVTGLVFLRAVDD